MLNWENDEEDSDHEDFLSRVVRALEDDTIEVVNNDKDW